MKNPRLLFLILLIAIFIAPATLSEGRNADLDRFMNEFFSHLGNLLAKDMDLTNKLGDDAWVFIEEASYGEIPIVVICFRQKKDADPVTILGLEKSRLKSKKISDLAERSAYHVYFFLKERVFLKETFNEIMKKEEVIL